MSTRTDEDSPRRKVVYVLPVYNEVDGLPHFHEALVAATDERPDLDFEFVYVNDGSRDKTPQIVDDLARRDPRVKAIHHKVNRGYGAALTSGFAAATGDFIMFMDADRQFDVNDLARLTPFAGDFDIVAVCDVANTAALMRLGGHGGHALSSYLASAQQEVARALHLSHGLAPHERPKQIRVVDELPRTATGKLQRYRLREMKA